MATPMNRLWLALFLLAAGPAAAQYDNVPLGGDEVIQLVRGGRSTTTTAAIAALATANTAVNVLSYPGIDPTGTADSSTAINAAATYACISTPPREVYFPAGTYLMTAAKLTAPCNGASFMATPGTAILKMGAASVSNPTLFQSASKSNVTVYGLTFDGGGVALTNASAVALVTGGDNVVFDHVTVQNSHGIGIAFNGANTNSGVRDSTLTNIGNYWITSGGSITDQQQAVIFCCGSTAANYGNFVTGSSFTNIGLDGVSATSQTNFAANNNSFKAIGGRYVFDGTPSGAAAIYVNGASALGIVGNTVNGTFGNGIDIINANIVNVVGNNVQFAGGAGISYANGSFATISGNMSCNNNKNGGIAPQQAGITLWGLGVALTDTTIAGNTLCDNQTVPTQTWGIQEGTGGIYTNVWIDQSNTPVGNVSGPFGEALSGYTPAKISAAVTSVTQTGASPNFGLQLNLSGTGALMVGTHDSSNSGGNLPGSAAIDLCTGRSVNTQVAAGQWSGCMWGTNNTVFGQFSAAGGTWNNVQSQGSVAWGMFASDRFRTGSYFAAGALAAAGDNQHGKHILHATTTSTAATRLYTTANTSATTADCVNLPNVNFGTNQEAIYGMSIRIVATDTTTVGNFLHYYEPAGTLTRTTTLASTAYSSSAGVITNSIGTAGTISVAADTTNACLDVTWTAPNAHTWRVMAVVDDAELY